MPRGYYRNVDDQYSDPELIATQYKVGRNAYFEVQLTLAEFAESIQSGTGGLQGSPDIAQSLAGAGGCPQVDQYVWTLGMEAIRASKLVDTEIPIYNPLTRNFNKVKRARILRNQPLVQLGTAKEIKNVVSTTHQIIRNTADLTGISLLRYGTQKDILSFDEGKLGKVRHWNIYSDILTEMIDVGFGDVVELELETEWIYVSGSTKKEGIVAHNRKDPEIVE